MDKKLNRSSDSSKEDKRLEGLTLIKIALDYGKYEDYGSCLVNKKGAV